MVSACQSATKKKQSYLSCSLHPVVERADEVAEMEFAGRPHPAQDAGFALVIGHQNLKRIAIKEMQNRSHHSVDEASTHQEEQQQSDHAYRIVNLRTDSGRKWRKTWLPSSGGTGMTLKTASSTLMYEERDQQLDDRLQHGSRSRTSDAMNQFASERRDAVR